MSNCQFSVIDATINITYCVIVMNETPKFTSHACDMNHAFLWEKTTFSCSDVSNLHVLKCLWRFTVEKKGDPIIESGDTLELCQHKHARKHELFCMDGQLLSESSSSVCLS
jgi:hypothetical protein